ncbi:MAG TPA: ribbon-helix-helix protein, CopG family [Aquificaceae bacterium]|nr:ribbon-helix-helix protein, CopG family [Aquificaceae bacterium]
MRNVVSIRLERSLLEEVDKVAKREGKARSVVVREALRIYVKNLKSEKSREGLVPFSEYRKVSEELKDALKKIGELERKIAELSKENELLKSKKRRWFF